MSGPDRDTESSYANLVREITGLPLIGMTLAGGDGAWSARHWDIGAGTEVAETTSENVRIVGERLTVSWNDVLVAPPPPQGTQRRSVSCWGPEAHADLTRRSVLVVGLGSVGLDVVLRLAATGVERLGAMDFDTVEEANLDRLIGATSADAWLRRSKAEVAERLLLGASTAARSKVLVSERSICEPEGLRVALDFDLVVSCVDRPWPRAVLNAMAYTDLIPIVDGGIAIDTFADGGGMRNATWRSHVIRPGRPCLSCNGQLDLGAVAADRAGVLEDPAYIAGLEGASAQTGTQNVAVLSMSAAASILAQYVSLNVAPGGIGEPGPLQYILSTHTLEHLNVASREHCPVEAVTAEGDGGPKLTGHHQTAEERRSDRGRVPIGLRAGRVLDDILWWSRTRLGRLARRRMRPPDSAERRSPS